MRFLSTRSVFLVSVLLMFAVMQVLPETPLINEANATHGGNPAILGLFNEQRKSNAVIDPAIGTNNLFQMDVNITDAGPWKAFDITITFSSTVFAFAGSSMKSPGCTAAQGCLLDGKITLLNANTTGTGTYRLAVTNQDGSTPFFAGTGIIFRIWFRALGNTGISALNIASGSTILNPGPVPYKPIHGYADIGTTTFNYPLTASPATVTVLRTVSGTNSTPAVTVTKGTPTGTASVTLSAIGLPRGATAAFTNNPCTPSCTSLLTITVTGGPAGGASTTPSGNYSIAILGNATVSGVFMIKSVWLKLVVKPPKPPVYNLAVAPFTSFTQESGNYTLLTITATRTSGANDSLTFGSNCSSQLGGGECTFDPPSGSFDLTATVNVTTPANLAPGQLGVKQFNLTATTGGTYSEVPVTLFVELTITIVRTHDGHAQSEALSRNFAYAGVSLAANPIKVNVTVANNGAVNESFTVNATARVSLEADFKIKYRDSTVPLGSWNSGEAVLYDTDGDGRYDVGEPVIVGVAPPDQTFLNTDIHLRFSDTNFNNLWNTGETVAYDTDFNGMFNPGEVVVGGPAILTGYLAGSQVVPLTAGQTGFVVTINWNPETLPRGSYIIVGAVTPVTNEFRLDNQAVSFLSFTQKFKGDVNGSCNVNIVDLSTVGANFGKTSSSPTWVPAADLNNDGIINIVDLVLVAGSFGQSC